MVELSSSELKTIVLDILKYLDSLCNELNLKYYLMGGTLLGAVRHGGFIPWDDDIDVMMPRKDYDKLVDYFKLHPNERYQLADWRLRSDYSFPMGKLMDTRTVLISNTVNTCKGAGAFIDIMPLDNIVDPKDLINRRKELGKLDTLIKIQNRMLKGDKQKFYKDLPLKKQIVYRLYSFISWKSYLKKYDGICRRFNDIETPYKATIAWIYYDREIYTDDILGEGVMVPFEDSYFIAPTKYDIFLKIVFGNYMELPPIDKQVSGHNFKVYWNN